MAKKKRRKRKKKEKRKPKIGLGWGNPSHFGAVPVGDGGNVSGLGEEILREYVKKILAN